MLSLQVPSKVKCTFFIDSYSKWLEIIHTDSATAEVTIRALRQVMSRWGLPLMKVSDNGPCFKAYEFVNFSKHNHIKHILVSPSNPASNGLAERAVQIFKSGVKNYLGAQMKIFHISYSTIVQLLKSLLGINPQC